MLFKHLIRRTFSQCTIKKSLENMGFSPRTILHNLSVAELYETAMENHANSDIKTRPTFITSEGAMAAYSGERTGRSPKDKRIVKDVNTEKEIWWGDINIPCTAETYRLCESRAIDYISSRPRVYVVDGYAGWDAKHRIKVRVICVRPYHALFMRNMLIVPTQEELQRDFLVGEPDYTVINAGEFSSSKLFSGINGKTAVCVNFSDRRLSILGTQYAGEMKKGVFTIMQYLMPKRGILSMHASANEGVNGDVTILFGLSGTGKTTLSTDPNRKLIGDDEHCWTDEGVFNIEGGCYAKCIGLSKAKEPEVFNAIKFGAVLENIEFHDMHSRVVNYNNISITENTRCSYPLEFIPGAKIPAVGGHPKNILFLTCDAYGVLPPVSKLTHEQAMYHFISGYTAKVAGTEVGVKEPVSTFSACFGEAFIPFHPNVYAELLAKKMKKHNTNAWLINTGWVGGKYGVGKRIDLKLTRKIIDAIHSGELEKIKTKNMPGFNLAIPEECPGVPTEILTPIELWHNKEEYNRTLDILIKDFNNNFKKYEDLTGDAVKNAAPKSLNI